MKIWSRYDRHRPHVSMIKKKRKRWRLVFSVFRLSLFIYVGSADYGRNQNFGIRLYTLFAVPSWWTLSFQLDLVVSLLRNVLCLWKFWQGLWYSDRLDAYHIYCTEITKHWFRSVKVNFAGGKFYHWLIPVSSTALIVWNSAIMTVIAMKIDALQYWLKLRNVK